MTIKTIYLDMDGVIVDFDGGVQEKFGFHPSGHRQWEYNYEADFGMTAQEFWSQLGHDYWANLKPTKEFIGIMELIYSRGLEKQTCLLSSPTLEPGSWSGKAEWVKKYLPHFFYDKQLILCQNKLWNVHSSALLIDDRYETCSNWVAAGGRAFVFPRPWNPVHSHEGRAVELLEEHLDYLEVGKRGKL